MSRLRLRVGGVALALSTLARADAALPPWVDLGDVPLPENASSVIARREEVALYTGPSALTARRGSATEGASFGLYGATRGPGCTGRFLLVGPLAWMCSDVAHISPDPPRPVAHARHADGLPYRYFFAGKEGASGYFNLAEADGGGADQELEPGWSVAVVEEATAHGERWGKSPHGKWFPMRQLGPANPFLFHGEDLTGGVLDVAWVRVDRASVYSTHKGEKAGGARKRFDLVHVREEKPGPAGAGNLVRVSDDDAKLPEWIRARDLARPTLAAPPPEAVGEDGEVHERWIDVELAQQTLVAYDGKLPVFATLVSTGKGAPTSDLGTRLGTHRIWVKLLSTKMDNLEREEAQHFYYIEDVPYVQFFDKAIALHGTFWHRDLGHVHSHGCVNLSPLDAERLFFFTGPTLPRGWRAVLPSTIDNGSLVRVR